MNSRIVFKLCLTFLFIFIFGLSYAANISLDASLYQSGSKFFLKIVNKSSTQFSTAGLTWYFNTEQAAAPFQYTIAPFETRDFEIPVSPPAVQGSYNLLAVLNYMNENSACSVLAGRVVSFGAESPIKPDAAINAPPVFKEGIISIKMNNPDAVTTVRAFFPDQLQVMDTLTNGNTISYKISNKNPSMNNSADIYVLFEKSGINGNTPIHSAGFISKTIKMGPFYTILNQSIIFWFIATPIFLLVFSIIFAAGYFYKKKGKPEKGELIQYVSLILFISFFTRFFIYNYPFNTFWDENYHVASAQKYIGNVMFMEPHPPLGKMLISLGEIILNPNQGIDTSSFLTTDYITTFPDGYSFLGVRFIPTLLSVLSSVLFFLILFYLSKHLQYSFLFSTLFLFDNGLIIHTRSAMLEGTQLFFILLAALYFVIIFAKAGKRKWTEYLYLGLLTGLAVSVKLNSMVLLLLFACLIIKEYFNEIKDLPWKNLTNKDASGIFKTLFRVMKEFLIKAGVSLAGIAFVFLLVYYIHFSLGERVLSGRYYRATDQYKLIISSGQTANPFNFPIMLRDNLEYTHNYEKGVPQWDPSKKDENGSPAIGWPVGYKSINYRWEKFGGKVSYFYFQGNPVVWWAALAGIILSAALIISRYVFGFMKKDNEKLNMILVFTLLYCAYMGAVLRITRVMYLYHYLIPLIFSLILFYLLFLYLFKELIEKNDKVLYYTVILFSAEVFAAYLFFGPLTYGLPLSAADFIKRAWLKVWDLHYIYF